jgi:hypothetical protein
MGVLLLAKIDAMALPDKTDGEEVLLSAAPGRATRRTGSVRTPWADWSSGTGGENRV